MRKYEMVVTRIIGPSEHRMENKKAEKIQEMENFLDLKVRVGFTKLND